MGKLIGLTGKAGAGKDTAANWLTTYRARDFRKIALADPLRAATTAIFGWDDSFYQHPKKNEVDEAFGVSPRKALQTLGTEWGRKLNEDLWLLIADAKAQPLLASGFNVLITDVRFENEAEYIRKNGGTIWHIDRDVHLVGTEAAHASEAGVKFVKGDVRINNNEVMGYLTDRLEKLADELLAEVFAEVNAKQLTALAEKFG